MDKLEETVEKQRRTVGQVVEQRVNDGRRWPGASEHDDASTLDPTFGDDGDEADGDPKHKFESMVTMIAARDNVPTAEAARRRGENSDAVSRLRSERGYRCIEVVRRFSLFFPFPTARGKSQESLHEGSQRQIMQQAHSSQ